jgi:hypothetical protein
MKKKQKMSVKIPYLPGMDLCGYKQFKYRGSFWLPQNNQDKIKGELQYKEGRISLTIFEGFDRDSVPFSSIIHGELYLEKRMTYVTLVTDKSTVPFNSPALIDCCMDIDCLLCGVLIERVANFKFTEVLFNLTGLEEWLNTHPIKITKGRRNKEPYCNIKYHQQPFFNIDVPRIKCKVTTTSEIHYKAENTDLNSQCSTFIKFVPEATISLERLKLLLFYTKRLLTILTANPTYSNLIKVYLKGVPTTVSLLITDWFHKEPVFARDQAVSFARIKDDIEKVFRKWFNLCFDRKARTSTAFNIFSDSFYNTNNIYRDLEYLTIMQSLETFHRTKYKKQYVSKKNSAGKINKIIKNSILKEVDALEDLKSDIKDCIKERFEQTAGHWNDYILRDRVLHLISLIGKKHSKILFPDKELLAARITKYRNFFTHRSAKPKNYSGNELYVLLKLSQLIIQYHLLKNLGVEKESIFKSLEFFYRFWIRKAKTLEPLIKKK